MKPHLLKSGFPHEEKIIALSEVLPTWHTIEDLIDRDLYHQSVIEAYKTLVGHPAGSDLPGQFQEILSGADREFSVGEHYKRFFNARGEEWGDFDKVLVARQIAKASVEAGETAQWEQTAQAFERLFERLNQASRIPLKEPGA